MQHPFQNGEVVDAVIKIQDKFLPIDSKFSLENYQRAIESENDEEKNIMVKSLKKI